MYFDGSTVTDARKGAEGSPVVRVCGIEWTRERAAELMKHRRPVPYVVGDRVAALNPVRWVREQTAALNDAPMRADRRRNLIRVVELIGKSWHPLTRVSTPGHDVIAAALGVSRKTVERLIADLIDRRIIYRSGGGRRKVLPDGSTLFLRAEYMMLRAQVLAARVVCARCEIGFRPSSPDDVLCRACVVVVERKKARAEAGAWNLSQVPRSKRERHQAAAAMQEHTSASGWLAGASAAAVASVCRRFWAAGWTPGDVLHAIEWRPDGAWTYDSRPNDVAGWLRHRLTYWVGSDGRPRASRSQRERAARERAAAARERARVEREREAAERAKRREQGPSAAQVEAWRVLAKVRPSGIYARRLRALGEPISTGTNVAPSLPVGGGSEIPTRAHASGANDAGGVEPPSGGDHRSKSFASAWRAAQQRRQTHPSPSIQPN